ncbi:hypothetical protein ABMA10_19370 [Plantibacter sp. RU18]
MAQLMEEARPSGDQHAPVWAWAGPATPLVVEQRLTSLLSYAEQGLDQYIVEFAAPSEHLFRTDYGEWCDYYFEVFGQDASGEIPEPAVSRRPTGDQITCWLLSTQWITNIARLDRSNWTEAGPASVPRQ